MQRHRLRSNKLAYMNGHKMTIAAVDSPPSHLLSCSHLATVLFEYKFAAP